jgi:quercetin dioxygenase-like cupin family protein
MKVALKEQAIHINNNSVCSVTEYPIDDQAMNFAIITISGRYPAENCAVNMQSKELAYVHAGAGKVTVNGKEQLLHQGDVVLIEAGEKIYWEGAMTLFVTCSPAWNKEQHLIVK